MSISKSQQDRTQAFLIDRFEAMGLEVRPSSDDRSVLVSMPITETPFESLGGPISVDRIVFSTIDSGRIKCLRPRSFFALPFIDVRDARNPAAIEASIRRAFRERSRELEDAAHWLSKLGIRPRVGSGGTTLEFPLPGESPETAISLYGRTSAVLPGAGPLSGLSLDSPAERVLPINTGRTPDVESGADLECLIAGRIDAVKRLATQREDAVRARLVHAGTAAKPSRVDALERITNLDPSPTARRPRVLVVGQRLLEHRGLRDALRKAGYRIATARSEPEALTRLAGTTPDLVLCEFGLGRSDGATLVHATRGLVGIEQIPVVLLDDAKIEARREAARAVGAAGYIVGPSHPGRFVKRLQQLVDEPGKRRFTRYPQRLNARLRGSASPCLATQVGRGGVFVATQADIDLHAAMQCAITLPELAADLHFEGEVLYRSDGQGALAGLGLRFSKISAEDESRLIAFLGHLESQRPPVR